MIPYQAMRKLDAAKRKLFNEYGIAVVLCILAFFYFSQMRGGHSWGDDFAQYIAHARNITEGRDYRDTGYIRNAHELMAAPTSYPPVFPMLLAPVYAMFGINLTAMKVEIIGLLLLSLFITYHLFRRYAGTGPAVVLVLVTGMNPLIWLATDNITSEIPFQVFCYLTFFYIQRFFEEGRTSLKTRHCAVTGILIYLCYGTRPVGLVFIPALIAYDLIRSRRLTKASLIPVAVFLCLMMIQNVWLHSDQTFLSHYLGNYRINRGTLLSAMRAITSFVTIDYENPYYVVIAAILTLISLTGYIVRVRREVTFLEVFFPFYLFTVLFYFLRSRYLFPVLPLFFYYMVVADNWFGEGRKLISRFVTGALILLIVPAYVISFRDAKVLRDASPDVLSSGATGLVQNIKTSTGPSDVVIFAKPRALALLTGRKSSAYHITTDPAALWNYFKSINATYVVAGPFEPDRLFLREFIAANSSAFRISYSNEEFTVFKIGRYPF